MHIVVILILILATIEVRAANPSFQSFDTNDFQLVGSATNRIIKARYTPSTNGVTYVTNLTVVNNNVTYQIVSNIVAANINGTTNRLMKFGPDSFSASDSIVVQNGTNSLSVLGDPTDGVGLSTSYAIIASNVWNSSNVRYWGAKGDESVDDSAAIQAALDALILRGGGELYFPAGRYTVQSSLTITAGTNGVALKGDAYGGTVLVSGITGAGADPMVRWSSQGNYYKVSDIKFLGNGSTGAGGNGHALAFINDTPGAGVTTYWPQSIEVKNCVFEDFRGTGKSETGAAIPACGIYAFGGLNLEVVNCNFYESAMGLRAHDFYEVRGRGIVASAIDDTGIYFDGVLEGSLLQSTIVGCGAGAATDGCFYFTGCSGVSLMATYAKNGNPYVLNLTGDTSINSNVAAVGGTLMQLDSTGSHKVVGIGSGVNNILLHNLAFKTLYSFTDAIGVEVIQGPGGVNAVSPKFSGLSFDLGEGGNYDACILLNVTNNSVIAPTIESCQFGAGSVYGSATTIGDCIRMDGNVRHATIRNNTFTASGGMTITNCVKVVNSETVTGFWYENNWTNTPAGALGSIKNEIVGTPYFIHVRNGAITTGSTSDAIGRFTICNNGATGVNVKSGDAAQFSALLLGISTNSFVTNGAAIINSTSAGGGTNQPISLQVGGNEYLAVTATGVGVGIRPTLANFQVQGSGYYSGPLTADGIFDYAGLTLTNGGNTFTLATPSDGHGTINLGNSAGEYKFEIGGTNFATLNAATTPRYGSLKLFDPVNNANSATLLFQSDVATLMAPTVQLNGTVGYISVNNGLFIYGNNGLSRHSAYNSVTGTAELQISHTGTNGVALIQSVSTGDAGNPRPISLNMGATTSAQVDGSTTAGDTRFLLWDVDTGALKRVSVSTNDSAGVGFKALRIPN